MFKNEYKVGNETQKLALSFIKFNILGAYEVKNSYLTEGNINITMDKFNTTVTPEIDRNKINSELDTYIENEFKENDKTLLGLLIIINIISVIALFITYTNSLLFISIIVIMILGNALLIYKMVSQSTITKKSKNIKKNSIKTALDFVLAEYTDCNNYINNNKTKYNQLKTFLESVNTTNYAKTNDERDLSIGE